jgi:putative transposase
MSQKIKPFYRKDLPHFQPSDDTVFFVTTRLDGSLPKETIDRLNEIRDNQIALIEASNSSYQEKKLQIDNAHKRFFGKYDDLLDNLTIGNNWLKIPAIAEIICNSLHFFDNQRYELICFTVLSNHIHVVFEVKKEYALYGIMQSLKSYSARKANELLDRSGQFWQHESYDRVVRDADELGRIILYTLNNPVKAGLCKTWEEWAFSYINPKYSP